MPDIAAFADFYRAVHGREPFGWQARLAGRVVEEGWPFEIGVPTGLGKTACIDISIWALAHGAGTARRQPTRTWYVANRRLLVDAAWEEALHLAALLADPRALPGPAGEAVASVAEALSGLAAFGTRMGPLYVARLRGGAELGARPPDPSQPSLVLATVPMFASRWLFRGYGSSSSMHPIDAAHAGIDSLVLLDEAHLARPLLTLSGTTAACDTGDPSAVFVGERGRPVMVAMTATGGAGGDRFELDDGDRANPVVAKRLKAAKHGRLVETTKEKLAEVLAGNALTSVNGEHKACVVFANTPRLARDTAEHLKSASRHPGYEVEVLLVTGRTRDREAERLRDRLLDPVEGVRAGHERHLERPLVVVATQTLEVGADVDFDHLVTESAGVRSLVQRLGRVNRLGNFERSSCCICHPADIKSWPVYAAEPGLVWARLEAAQRGAKDLDLSPGNISDILGAPQDTPARVGELLPAHLWEWAKTTSPPPGEAPVELFFEGFSADGDLSVLWRAHRPTDGVRLVPAVSDAESVDVPVSELRDLLAERPVRRLADDRASLETVGPAALRPGDVVVLGPEDGLYDEHGWAPKSKENVLDVSPLRSGTLLLAREVLDNLAPGCLPHVGQLLKALAEPPEDEGTDDQAALAGLVQALRACPPHAWLSAQEWEAFLDGLGSTVARPIDDVASVGPVVSGHGWISAPLRAEAFEELSFLASSVALDQHLGAVGEAAGRLAEHLGLPAELVRALRLGGEYHDLGKQDPRFQRWLDPEGTMGGPLAKSVVARGRLEGARVASGWPRGGRHELLSARVALALLECDVDLDVDLVVHLIASHHGQGRPFVRVVDDRVPTNLIVEVAGERIRVSANLAAPDWEQPRRFRALNERYGLWGLALLEAVLRQADHAVSQVAGVA